MVLKTKVMKKSGYKNTKDILNVSKSIFFFLAKIHGKLSISGLWYNNRFYCKFLCQEGFSDWRGIEKHQGRPTEPK